MSGVLTDGCEVWVLGKIDRIDILGKKARSIGDRDLEENGTDELDK